MGVGLCGGVWVVGHLVYFKSKWDSGEVFHVAKYDLLGFC